MQVIAICNNYIADIEAWVAQLDINIPVLSDFLNRTTTGNLTGLKPDGTPHRGTFVLSPTGEVVYEHVRCDTLEHHTEDAIAALYTAMGTRPGTGMPEEQPNSDAAQAVIDKLKELER